ncbi:MAG: hypothetical protein WBI17_04430 [Clostridiaceae bacterium]
MDRNGRGNGPKSTVRIILAILLIIFAGPVVVSTVGSIIIGLFGISLSLLVIALILLASPILVLAFPNSLGFNVPQMALFFFGIAVLSIFVLSVAIVIKLSKWIILTILNVVRRLFGYI